MKRDWPPISREDYKAMRLSIFLKTKRVGVHRSLLVTLYPVVKSNIKTASSEA